MAGGNKIRTTISHFARKMRDGLFSMPTLAQNSEVLISLQLTKSKAHAAVPTYIIPAQRVPQSKPLRHTSTPVAEGDTYLFLRPEWAAKHTVFAMLDRSDLSLSGALIILSDQISALQRLSQTPICRQTWIAEEIYYWIMCAGTMSQSRDKAEIIVFTKWLASYSIWVSHLTQHSFC